MNDPRPTIQQRVARFGIRYWNSFSFVGLVFATLFFAASVTPSLIPRHYMVQGLMSGFAIATGYGIGILTVWLWHFWELPEPNPRLELIGKRLATAGAAILFAVFLRQMTFWQNSIRELMSMEPLETTHPYRTGVIAVLVGMLVVAFVRLLIRTGGLLSERLNAFLPRRISLVISGVIVTALVLTIINGVLAKQLLNFADKSFSRIDELIDQGVTQPVLPTASGSDKSLIPWDTIGRRGKLFIVEGPTEKELSEFAGFKAKQPLRVYVGLRSSPTMKQRAELALAELKRVGGFDRSVLIVATPTGTGWLDPSGVDTVEYLHHGDTAIVSMQYSYLPSWLTIAIDPQRSRESAHALFEVIYEYWKTLPHDKRPRFYLHGLSLGALGSETCADLFTIFEDPTHGALWSGPPSPSTQWANLTAERNEDSPAWLPTFRDSAMVRFTAQKNALNTGQRWGPIRSVYLQYASDPMVFGSPDLLFKEPDWLKGPRGPDVSPHLRWYPIITFLQIAFDLPMATSVPLGHGHNYAPAHYIDAWIAVTNPQGWDERDTQKLKTLFADRIPASF